MHSPLTPPPPAWGDIPLPTRVFWLAALGITAFRLIGLMVSPINLHFDEAQYWSWSRSLEWGYFSKPPLIAWAIAATTGLFGNGEAAVRLASPFGHLLAAAALFLLTRRLYGPMPAVWAGLGWLLLPGVALSSAVISTDALLLPLWACALFALFRFLETPGWRWAVVLGGLIGLGALAKYAMLYFVLCAGLAAVFVPRIRGRFWSRDGATALGSLLLVLSPNLAWNAGHGFATIAHTAANANLGGSLFNPLEMLDFVFSQAGVVGPVLWGVLGLMLWRALQARTTLGETERILIAFILPPLALITAQAFLSRAHANWAAAAYPAALVFLAGRLTSVPWGRKAVWATALVNGVASLAFVAFAAFPSFADAVGAGGAFKRARGWDAVCAATADQVARSSEPYSAILVDHRALYFALRYYCRPERVAAPLPPVRMWLLHEEAENQAALEAPMTPAFGAHVLAVNMGQGYVQLIHDDFAEAAFRREVLIDLGAGETRWIGFSDLHGFQPVTRDAAFDAFISGPPLPLPPVAP